MRPLRLAEQADRSGFFGGANGGANGGAEVVQKWCRTVQMNG
jgi:hypothetical protein